VPNTECKVREREGHGSHNSQDTLHLLWLCEGGNGPGPCCWSRVGGRLGQKKPAPGAGRLGGQNGQEQQVS
jgi:hypothetical protein